MLRPPYDLAGERPCVTISSRAPSSRPRRATCCRCPSRGTPEHARLEALGAAALERGEVGLVVLAGGMATRMGGVVKALVEAVDGLTFLDIRLREMDASSAATAAAAAAR